MTKFCGKCGAELKDEFCTSCGAKAGEAASSAAVGNDVNEYFREKMMNKKKHNGYRMAAGIIMIILGALLCCVAIAADDIESVDVSSYNVALVFLIPGLFTLVGGILSIISRKVNVLLLVSGILYALAAICNAIGIENISLLFIICAVYAPVNIVYYVQALKLEDK